MLLQLSYPDDYPSVCPKFELHAPWLRGALRQDLMQILNDVCRQHDTQAVSYALITRINDWLQERADDDDALGEMPEASLVKNLRCSCMFSFLLEHLFMQS